MNISEIARLAGVSSAAVSRFLNGGYLSDEKRESIQKVIEETGYRPSTQARMLRTRKTNMIGVIAPKMVSESVGSMVEGIQKVLNENGYHILLGITGGQAEKELEYLRTFNEKQVDGVLMMGTAFTEEHRALMRELTIPLIILGQWIDEFSCVYHDDYRAIYDVTTKFLQQGRRKLGYLSAFHADESAGRNRYYGFRDAVSAFGLPELGDNYVITDFSIQSGYEKAKEILDKVPDLDCLICATDGMATGAYRYFREQGFDMPEQIILSGVGDSKIGRIANKDLLSVHLEFDACGSKAAQLALDQIKDAQAPRGEIMLGYRLVEK